MDLGGIIVLLFTIAHVAVCADDIHNVMPTHLVEMIFQTSYNSVPTHELVEIKSFPKASYSPVDGSRILGPGKYLWVQTFASDIHLWLHPREGVAHENTPVYTTEKSSLGLEKVAFKLLPGAMKEVGKLYEDPKHWASMVIGIDASGKTRVNGHIGSHKLTVRSLPDDVVKEYLRTRRSINETEYESSNTSYHVVFRSTEESEKKLPASFNNLVRKRNARIARATPSEIPYQLVLEILLVVDYSHCRYHQDDVTGYLEYLVAFWNDVALKYRNLENPRIRIHITAIIMETVPQTLSYLWDSQSRDGVLDFQGTLFYAAFFFANIADSFPLESYDIAVTMTKQQLGEIVNQRVSVGGAATGSICKRKIGQMFACAVIMDGGGIQGSQTAAHELGHVLGLTHDQDKNCDVMDGYIMSETNTYTENMSSLSNCSITLFDKLLRNQSLTCLYNQPEITDYALPDIMLGKMKSLKQQCKDLGYDNHCIKKELDKGDICANICCDKESYPGGPIGSYLLDPALEGTSCGSLPNMYCLRRRCTQVPEPSTKALYNMYGISPPVDQEKSI